MQLRWMLWVLVLSGIMTVTGSAEDPATVPAATPEAAAAPVVSITDKWSVLVNPARPRPGIVKFNEKSPIQNVEEFKLLGPMVGHPFGLGELIVDGRWATAQGLAQRIEGKNTLVRLATADQFELEGIIHQEGLGGWFMLLGWNQGHGYSLSNVVLKDSGAPWFICEYRGAEAIVPTNNEVKQFEWRGDQPLRLSVKQKLLTVKVGQTLVVENYPLDNYTAGELSLGTYDTRYGPRTVQVRSLRIREVSETPEKPAPPGKPANKAPSQPKEP